MRLSLAPAAAAVAVGIAISMGAADVWHDRARAYQQSINRLEALAAGRPIVIELRAPGDIEAVYALWHYLPVDSMMLAPVTGRVPEDEQDVVFQRRVDDITATGSDGSVRLQLAPFTAPTDCVSALVGVAEATACPEAVTVQGALGPINQ